jgi:hypothetical protein
VLLSVFLSLTGRAEPALEVLPGVEVMVRNAFPAINLGGSEAAQMWPRRLEAGPCA